MPKEKFWNVPNAVSMSRIFLVLISAFFLLDSQILLAFTFLVLAALSDFFDGYFARKLNQGSELGALLDHMCDKACVLIFVITLFILLKLPIYVFLILTRDIVTVAFGIFLKSKHKGLKLKVSFLGKTVTALQFIALGVILLFPEFTLYTVIVVLFFTVVSLIDYSVKISRMIGK